MTFAVTAIVLRWFPSVPAVTAAQAEAPEHAQGQYQGLAGTGMTPSFMLAPSVVALLPLGLGQVGWLDNAAPAPFAQ